MAKDDQANDEDLPLEVPAPEKEAERRTMFGWLLRRACYLPLLFLLMATGGVIGMYFQPPLLQYIFKTTGLEPGGGTDTPIALPAQVREALETGQVVPSRTDIVALGKILPKDDVITVAPPYGAGDARVARIEVRIGDKVAEGDTIAVLDNLAQLQSGVDSARAGLAVKDANLQQVRQTVRASKAEERAALERAQSVLENAQTELQRTRELFDRGIVTRAALDNAESARRQADRDVERAKATLGRFDGDDLDSQPDVIVALRNLEAARAELTAAQRDLDKAYVRAPSTGTVLDIHVRSGEKPGEQGVADIGDLEAMKVEIEVYQTEIGRVALGDEVEVIANAFDRRLAGTVTQIGLEVGRQTIIDDDPVANTDARVITVTAGLEPASSQTAARFTNLEVVARIKSGKAQ